MYPYDQLNRDQQTIKLAVKMHWETEPCELRAGKTKTERRRFFEEIDTWRYSKNPFIPAFAKFEEARNKRVLEIGLGSASDFIRWARNGAKLSGRDLTEASVNLAKERLTLEGLTADVAVGDVESLEFESNSFDIVYSYGTIHHTPDTPAAVRELYRVARPGGTVRVMIYNALGLTYFYEWLVLCAVKKRLIRSIREAVFYYNESLGTKLYTVREARALFSAFRYIRLRTIVCAGDVLDFELSERYRQVPLIRNSKRLLTPIKYLRPLIPLALGGFMLIEATK
jgi:ubiquinone/menaquinone biosynthesis C-methylase UbiE